MFFLSPPTYSDSPDFFDVRVSFFTDDWAHDSEEFVSGSEIALFLERRNEIEGEKERLRFWKTEQNRIETLSINSDPKYESEDIDGDTPLHAALKDIHEMEEVRHFR